MPVFQDLELDEEFVFTKDTLPTTNDVLKYAPSKNDIVMREFVNRHIVVEQWEKADCCHHPVLRITQLF